MVLIFRDQIKLWDATEMAIGFLLSEMMMACSLLYLYHSVGMQGTLTVSKVK